MAQYTALRDCRWRLFTGAEGLLSNYAYGKGAKAAALLVQARITLHKIVAAVGTDPNAERCTSRACGALMCTHAYSHMHACMAHPGPHFVTRDPFRLMPAGVAHMPLCAVSYDKHKADLHAV